MAPMPYPPEPAKPHDLPEALDLLRRSQLPTQGVVEHFGNYVVVRDEGHLVGMAGIEIYGSDGLLRSVVVDPDYRGEGAGRALIDGAMAMAKRMALRQVYLLTTGARAYFERQGFADCARDQAPPSIQQSWEFREGCPSSSALMRRGV
jgi:N-acetylglutamate synthase-like GNAT family acetyltransferase